MFTNEEYDPRSQIQIPSENIFMIYSTSSLSLSSKYESYDRNFFSA